MTPNQPPVGTELKACPTPWCDKPEPYVFHRAADIYGVCCKNCGVSTNYHHGEAPAVEQWNTRPPVEASEVVERLLEALSISDAALTAAGSFILGHDTQGGRKRILTTINEAVDNGRLFLCAAAIPATGLVEPTSARIEDAIVHALKYKTPNPKDARNQFTRAQMEIAIRRAMQSAAPGSSEGEVERLRAEVQRLRNILNEEGLVDPELAALAGKRIDALTISARKGKRNFAAPGSSPQAREGEQS